MKRLIGIGAGGHAKVLIEILQHKAKYELVGLLDTRQKLWNCEVLGVRVLGDDGLLPELRVKGVGHAFIGLGGVGENSHRSRVYSLLISHGFQLVNTIHSHALISKSARIGNGVMVMAGAIINAESTIGNNVIINTGSIVEHECVIGDHVHIASGACLAGGVGVDNNAHIGVGASIRQGIHIGRNAIVGAGAVVIRDVEPDTIVVGVPAHILQKKNTF